MPRLPIILCLLAAHDVFAIDVIAHRGYACTQSENTVLSVQHAWRAGADAVEVDVRVSDDGIVYLFHDEKIRNQKIANLQFSEIVSLSDRPIDRLSEVLEVSDTEGYFVLDLKTHKHADVDKILGVVRASRVPERLISFQSTSIKSLEYIRAAMPDVELAFLSHLEWKIPYVVHPGAKQLVDRLNGRDIDRVSIKGRSFIDQEYIEIIKSSGHEVHVWTINDPERAVHYRNIGVDGVITDRVKGLFEGTAQARECSTPANNALHLQTTPVSILASASMRSYAGFTLS